MLEDYSGKIEIFIFKLIASIIKYINCKVREVRICILIRVMGYLE